MGIGICDSLNPGVVRGARGGGPVVRAARAVCVSISIYLSIYIYLCVKQRTQLQQPAF